MKRIMLATDFSERSDRALRRAVLVARAHGTVLDLLHVVDDDRPRRIVEHEIAQARALLHELAQSLQTVEGIRCDTNVVVSDPFAGIVSAVTEGQPDLLVIGPHRRKILQDIFVGTTAERAIRSVGCPVLMVNGPPVTPWRHVLLTTDLSDNARAGLSRFTDLGLGGGARLSVLHVYDAPALRLSLSGALQKDDRDSYLADRRRSARRGLAEFMAGLGSVRAEAIVRYYDTTIAQEIRATADEQDADLIVLCTRGHDALRRMVLGSVTGSVLQHSRVDVLTLPPARPA